MAEKARKYGVRSWTKARGRDSSYHGCVHNNKIRSRPRSGFSDKVLPDSFSTGHFVLRPSPEQDN